MSQYTSELIKFIINGLCDLLGEQTNTLWERAIEGLPEHQKKQLACVVAAMLDLRDGEVAKGRYKCMDLSKAFGIPMEGIKCQPDTESFELRETYLLPKIIEVLGKEGFRGLHSFFTNMVRKDPIKVHQILENHFRTFPLFERFQVIEDGDILILRLCYKSAKAARGLSESESGGLLTGLFANIRAMLLGYDGARHLKSELSGNCVDLVFKMFKL